MRFRDIRQRSAASDIMVIHCVQGVGHMPAYENTYVYRLREQKVDRKT
jgi:hypothetical protein